MTQQYHTGGEGIALLDGIDFNITDANMNVQTDLAETTNTSDYNPTERVVYKNQITAARQGTGNITFGFDSNNLPWTHLKNPDGVPCVINFASSGATFTGSIDLESFDVRKNGMTGKVEVSCSYRTKSIFTFT